MPTGATGNAVRHDDFDPSPDPLSSHDYGKWPGSVVTWRVANPPAGLSLEQARGAVAAAFAEWAQYIAIRFVESPGGADITISSLHGDTTGQHGDSCPFDASTLAHSFFPNPAAPACPYGQIHFNEKFSWSLQVDASSDYQHTVLHEIGHALGLPHITDPQAVMYAFSNGRRTLYSADVAAIRGVYQQGGGLDAGTGWPDVYPKLDSGFVWPDFGVDSGYPRLDQYAYPPLDAGFVWPDLYSIDSW